MSFFAEDCVLEMPRGSEACGARLVGIEAVKKGLRSRFEGLPDVHYGEAEHFASGDTGISQWTITGTSSDGQRVEVRGCDFYTFRDGKVVRKNSFWKFARDCGMALKEAWGVPELPTPSRRLRSRLAAPGRSRAHLAVPVPRGPYSPAHLVVASAAEALADGPGENAGHERVEADALVFRYSFQGGVERSRHALAPRPS